MATDWLTANVTDGIVEQTVSETSKKSKGGEMGKDEFLQLLVAQMKYQDPLQPTDNTQYVSQLATFSQLEQMQNLNQTNVNSQAFGLVGKEVIMKTTSSTGEVTYKQGTVEYVTKSGAKAFFSIEGSLYNVEDLYSVVGENYIANQKGPKVDTTELTYDHSKPEDVSFKISLGEGDYEASQLALFINGQVVSSDYLGFDHESNTVTVSNEAFKGLEAGTYKVAVMFDDINTTTYTDKISLKIKGDKPVVVDPEETEKDEADSTDKTDSTDETDSTDGTDDTKE